MPRSDLLYVIWTLSVLLLSCNRGLQNNSDSARIETAEISDGTFFHRPIIIFVNDKKIEGSSARVLPGETTIKAVVQKDYDVAGLYIQEPITKIIGQSPASEITFSPLAGKKYKLFGKVLNKKATLWIEDDSSGEVVAGDKPES